MPKEPDDRKHLSATQDLFVPATGYILPAQGAEYADDLSVSARIRALRRERGISIRALATKCGISGNTLSLIENNRTSPSLHTLQLLANGLGVSLSTFFTEEKPEHSPVYQQQGQRSLVHFANGTLEKLDEGLPPLGAEPVLVTIESHPGNLEDICHAGREFIYCLDGKVTCVVDNQAYHLSPGDSLLFDARKPHRWLNAYPGSSKLLVLFCPMDAHDQPAARHLNR